MMDEKEFMQQLRVSLKVEVAAPMKEYKKPKSKMVLLMPQLGMSRFNRADIY